MTNVFTNRRGHNPPNVNEEYEPGKPETPGTEETNVVGNTGNSGYTIYI